ncbi:MAG: hypothetical protein IKC77_10310 [Lentisphaeria bacterium]|nr:hypothetical protein [Lentisphaeria bacterium]
MKEDIYEPLERYASEFKDKFAEISSRTFEELVTRSGIDIAANRKTVADIGEAEKKKNGLEGKHSLLVFLAVILWIAVAISAVYALYCFFGDTDAPVENKIGAISGFILSLILLLKWIHPAISGLGRKIEELKQEIENLISLAYSQMASLNRLFTWDLLPKMMSECVPRLEFDPYFCRGRVEELENSFDWNSSFNNDISILFAHSGVINDNPFVVCKFRRQVWGQKTYYGEKVITYYEMVRGSDGKMHREMRTQTLVASVTKPIPEYVDRSAVIYGNDAAPELTFSREPSEFSGEDGFFSNLAKKSELKKLEKLARNLDDDSNFTMMSNKEFEVLFHAEDRSDEIQFRLLFTPLAQQQMVRLLNDKEHGYGDDFTFLKQRKINMLYPLHLDNIDIDVDPQQFTHYSFDRIKEFFVERTNEYFKAMYFSFAPLLTVPLYQQTRTFSSIYGDFDRENVSFWETESFVNYLGEQRFRHKNSVTSNILKASDCYPSEDGTVVVEAHGFRGVEHTEYVSVYGNDGKWHNVPVEWVEYLPVCKTSRIEVGVADQESAAKDTLNIRRRLYVYG